MLHKVSLSVAVLAIALSGLGLDGAIATTTTTRSQSTPSSQATANQRQTLLAGRLGFTVRGIRPSRSRIGGISRGGLCNAEGQPDQLMALLPSNNPSSQTIDVESTTVDRPSFFVFVPQTQAQAAEFLLLNEAGDQVIYETILTLPDAAGVVGIRLPDDAPALEVGKQYQWSLSVICDPVDRTGDLFVEGWVERVELSADLSVALEQAAPRDRPTLFADAGIWQDTIGELANLRYSNPSDQVLSGDWASLLESVGLTSIANEPLLPMLSHGDAAPAVQETDPSTPAAATL